MFGADGFLLSKLGLNISMAIFALGVLQLPLAIIPFAAFGKPYKYLRNCTIVYEILIFLIVGGLFCHFYFGG